MCLGRIDAHKLIISKYPHDDIIEREIQKRSLVTEDLVHKPVVTLTEVLVNNEPVDLAALNKKPDTAETDLEEPDENFHITVGSEEDVSGPREITLYVAGKTFCVCPRTRNGYNLKSFSLPIKPLPQI